MLRVLIINPLPEQSSLVGDMIQDWGHSVTVASSGASALTDGAERRWHLVFIGLEQLSMEGVEWIARMRCTWPGTLLIVIGDLDQPDLERRVRTEGVDFYLQKASDLPRLRILMQHFESKCSCPKDTGENLPKIMASDG